jgi:mRNA interferase MazF
VKRGDVVIASTRGYAGKPRPAVVVQSDIFVIDTSIVVCPMTGTDVGVSFLRPAIDPDAYNNLARRSWIMIDKVGVIEKSRIGAHVGALRPDQMRMLDERLAVFLGLPTS